MDKMKLIKQLLKKPYAPIMEIVEVYGINFKTFNKYVSESKVKIIKRGSRCTYKTSDVHKMLSERGYPKLKLKIFLAPA